MARGDDMAKPKGHDGGIDRTRVIPPFSLDESQDARRDQLVLDARSAACAAIGAETLEEAMKMLEGNIPLKRRYLRTLRNVLNGKS